MGLFEVREHINHQTHDACVDFFKAIRENPKYDKVPIYVACENQPGSVLLVVQGAVNLFYNITCLGNSSQSFLGGLGVAVNSVTKTIMFTNITQYIRTQTLTFMKDMIAMTNKPRLAIKNVQYHDKANFLRATFVAQAENMTLEDGKITGKGVGVYKDDVVMALAHMINGFHLIKSSNVIYFPSKTTTESNRMMLGMARRAANGMNSAQF